MRVKTEKSTKIYDDHSIGHMKQPIERLLVVRWRRRWGTNDSTRDENDARAVIQLFIHTVGYTALPTINSLQDHMTL